jgi:hypothetical protein
LVSSFKLIGLRRFVVSEMGTRGAVIFQSVAFFSWLGCYVFTSSYDYRLLFLYPGILFFLVCFNVAPCDARCRGLRLYLAALLLLWPLIVVAPLLYVADLSLSVWQGQLVWWMERASDTFCIPVIAGAMLALAVDPRLIRRFMRLQS